MALTPVRPCRALLAGTVAAVLVTVSCSSGTAKTAAPSTTGGAATSAPDATAPDPTAPDPNAPDPNAPETNDPGDIPDNQAFVTFGPPGAGYSVKVPEGWARAADGAATTFTDKFNLIRMASTPASAQPTIASATEHEVPDLRSATPGFTLGRVSTVNRKHGTAVLITYEANSAPNAVTGKSIRLAVERYAFWKDGTEVVLTLSGAKGADNVDPWKIVTDGFTWGA